MKRAFILLALAVTAFLPLHTHAQVIFSEDFDGIGGPTAGGAGTYTFPAGWFLRNVDNRTPAGAVAYVNEAWERREDFNFSVIDSAAFSTSWYNPAGAADDWMWTPLIGPLPASAELKWNAVTYDPLYPDGYEVRVMTSSQGPPTGGTGAIGNQLTNSTQVFSIASESTSWINHTVSLSAYAGQSVYIGFRNNSNDKFLLLIDDVIVEAQIVNDAAMIAKDTLEYTMIPELHQTTAPFQGTIRNSGTNTINGVHMQVIVRDGLGGIVYNASSAVVASLAPSATAVLTVPSAGTLTPDTYTVQYIAKHGTTDPVATNDTLEHSFVIDPQTYARDDGNVTGALGIGAGNGGYVGQDFTFQQNDVVDTVMVYFTQGYTGEDIQLEVFNSGPGGPTTSVGTTILQQYPDDSGRVYLLALQGGGVAVTAGSTYAFEVIEFDSTVQVGLTNTIHTPGSTWVDWPTNPFGNWANNEQFGVGFAKPYVIRPMTACADFAIDSFTVTSSTCNNGFASPVLNGSSIGATYLWSTGATTPNLTGVAAGTYTVTVTLVGTCSDTGTVVVPANALNVNVIGNSILCNGDTVSLTATATGGTAAYSFSWSTGDTTATINTGAGSYTVTVTDASGCTATTPVTLSEPTALLVSVSNTQESGPGANDGTATATPSGGTPPYTYLWSTGGTTATISGLTAGTYTVVVTDANGCQVGDNTSVITHVRGSLGDMTFQAYPSPNNGLFQVEFTTPVATDVTLEILDMSGKLVYREAAVQSTGFKHEIDLRDRTSGMYFLRVLAGDAVEIVKIEVKK